jgi:tRNA-dihydrouridine synthase B
MLAEKTLKNKLQIGNVLLNSIVAVAPMAGITDLAFRQISRKFSVNCLLMTEMISSEALKWNKEQDIINSEESEAPISFQISGHKSDLMRMAAQKLEDKATIIDINMGCPAPKIVRNGDGSALMQTPKLASEIVSAVKNAVKVPVTVKFRLGWDNNTKNYLEFAKLMEQSGADAIIVHARTRTQMYTGKADWEAISEVKQAVNIPVIGNGDIDSVKKAVECLKISNCDGIAIGRGALGNPELISNIEHYLNTGEILPELTISQKVEILKLHLDKEIYYRDELMGIKYTRKFFGWYIKGIREAAKYRDKLIRLENYDEILSVLDEIAKNG